MIDPREKERLFEEAPGCIETKEKEPSGAVDLREKQRFFKEAMTRHGGWLALIARDNAPSDSLQDLQQDILVAFWASLDAYDGKSSGLDTWFFSVARHTVEEFRRKRERTRKGDEAGYRKPSVVEPDLDVSRIVEEFPATLGEVDRQVFTMYRDCFSYSEMSAALGIDEVNLRKRISRIREQLKARYKG